jgi:hypothetical protein
VVPFTSLDKQLLWPEGMKSKTTLKIVPFLHRDQGVELHDHLAVHVKIFLHMNNGNYPVNTTNVTRYTVK